MTYLPEEGKLRVEMPAITLGDVDSAPLRSISRRRDWLIDPTVSSSRQWMPNPASTNSDVIHPHVKDGELCAGDAKAPINAALASGRLADAFLIIQSTLTDLQRRSAYVKLDQWHGVPCSDCSRIY